MLGICLTVDSENATLLGLSGPPCVIGEVLGPRACPGCGITRSTALVMHGAWYEALVLHPAGWMVVLLCAAGALVHIDILRRGARSANHDRLLRVGWAIFAGGLTLAWLLRLVVLTP